MKGGPERHTQNGLREREISMNESKSKKICIALVAVVGALACRAAADEIKIGRLSYKNVAVTGERDGEVLFVFRGNKVSKPLSQVARIHLSNRPFFNTGESLRRQGRFAEAARTYQRAITRAPGTLKSLVAARMKLAKNLHSGAPAAPRTAAPLKGKCPHCRGTGLMGCPDCKGTGRASCGDCLGKRWVTCPTCSGNWGRKCPDCKGKKRIQVGRKHEGSGGIFVRPIYEPCKRCDATGYVCTIKFGTAWISRAGMCPTCGNNEPQDRGKMPCPKCKGVGRCGPCPRCKGTRKTICTYCVKVSKTDPVKGAAKSRGASAASPADAWAFKPGTAARAKRQYDLDANSAKIEYERRLKDLNAKLNYTLKDIRRALIGELGDAVKEVAANGDLDEAVKIRDAKIAAEKGLKIPVKPPAAN